MTDASASPSGVSGTFSVLSSERQLHFCGIRIDGSIACWGQVRVGPTPPAGNFKNVYVGGYDNCALRTDDTVACWGSDSPNPQWTPPSGTFRQLSVSGYYGCGLRPNGSVECWGSLANSNPSGTFQSISAGNFAACGVRESGAIACWGYGYQLPPGVTGTFSSVSAGDGHACAIRSDGVVVCWGDTIFGQSDGCTADIGCIWAGP